MAPPAAPEPDRRPLRVPIGATASDGPSVDGSTVLRPGDPGYEDAYRTACYLHQEYGDPMPYAEDEPRLPGNQGAAASSGGLSRNPAAP